jgi:hypothetical protein
VAKNIHPHRLSRGGYELLTEKMMAEKRSLQDSTLSDERSPSPPPREEKWKRARQGKDGEYKSAATKVVADKIVSKIWISRTSIRCCKLLLGAVILLCIALVHFIGLLLVWCGVLAALVMYLSPVFASGTGLFCWGC